MSIRKAALVQAGLLLLAILPSTAAVKNMTRITVLESVTRATTADNNNGVPLNCDQLTFDAYCRSTSSVPLVSTLLVQEGDAPPFRVSCTIESKYSRCAPLPKGASFEARREKHGITIYYIDDKGRARSQLYKLVDANAKAGSPATVAAVATRQSPAAAPIAAQASVAPAPRAVAPVQTAPAPAPVQSPVPAAPPPLAEKPARDKIKCNFSSTPPGAEINVDWRYVGNTPSEIGLSTGTHVVVISMPGFAEWKRELTVGADSVVNVTANLQKTQP
jgi:hypothetical protein